MAIGIYRIVNTITNRTYIGSSEHRAKIAAASKGHAHTLEARAKMCASWVIRKQKLRGEI